MKANGLQLIFDHLAFHFNTSEPETRRLLREFGAAFVAALQEFGEVELPRLGKVKLNDDKNLEIEVSDVCKDLLVLRETEVPPERDVSIHQDNHRDVIRQSLFKYLTMDFPLEQPWQHPNGTMFTYKNVREQLTKLRLLDDLDYHLLWNRVLFGRRLDRTAYAFNISESAAKRRCDLAISAILTLLIHENLQSETITRFYRIED